MPDLDQIGVVTGLQELCADAASVGGGPIDVLQVAIAGPEFTGDYDMWAAIHDLSDKSHAGDDDGDGWSNLEEYFYGLDPCEDDRLASPLDISYDSSSGDYTLAFRMNAVLVDPSAPGTLRDSSTLDITSSMDAVSFSSVSGTPSVGSTAGGQTDLSYTASASSSSCFFRLEITPSTPSP